MPVPPHTHSRRSTSDIMRTVILCSAFGIAAQWFFFGWGVLLQVILASTVAIASEAAILTLRKRPVFPYLRDNSALLTGILVGISIPPLAPWWITVIGGCLCYCHRQALIRRPWTEPLQPCDGSVCCLADFISGTNDHMAAAIVNHCHTCFTA